MQHTNLTLLEDLNTISSDLSLPWQELYNKTILVTGATGLLGSLFIQAIITHCKKHNQHIDIIACIRNENKFNQIFNDYKSFTGLSTFNINTSNTKLLPKTDFVLHTASITDSSTFISKPLETINTILMLTQKVIEHSKKYQSKVLFLSSMEIYGSTTTEYINETDLGYIEILKERSSYPQAKRMAETMCYCASKEYNSHIVIARPTLTFGAGITLNDNRVFAQFLKSIINKTDIIMHTEGLSCRDFLYTTDAIAAIIILLTKGSSGEAYNISNETSYMSIKDLAILCTTLTSDSIKIKIDLEQNKKYPPTVKIKLNTTKLQKLGWKPKISIKEALQRTKNYLENFKELI